MNQASASLDMARAVRSERPLLDLYLAEAVAVVSGALFTVGLPFFTHHRFGWGALENFLLGGGQGLVYVVGALMAEPISRRWGRRNTLMMLYQLLALLGISTAAAAAWGLTSLFVVLVIGEMMLIATTWPLLESLVSSDVDAAELSRRLGVYNVTWATVGTITMAACGAIIQYAPGWVFFAIAAGGHLASLGFLARSRHERGGAEARSAILTHMAIPPVIAVPPALAAQRRQALWLSRISLPATYVVVYSLAPLLPSLPALQRLSPTVATVVASVWLAARAVAFVITGRTTFWHVRPGLLLWAAVIMLVAFAGTVIPPALGGLTLATALGLMLVGELVLGLCLGMIYAASLYFGMVLSEGSTEHGGYHEALIGLGQILGPGIGAAMLWARPGNLGASMAGVFGILATSVAVAGVAKLRVRREAGA